MEKGEERKVQRDCVAVAENECESAPCASPRALLACLCCCAVQSCVALVALSSGLVSPLPLITSPSFGQRRVRENERFRFTGDPVHGRRSVWFRESAVRERLNVQKGKKKLQLTPLLQGKDWGSGGGEGGTDRDVAVGSRTSGRRRRHE